ncbi:MAG: alpha-galactosidase [Planctomycetota bacterium]
MTTGKPTGTEIAFKKEGRPGARYVSATTVYEEALERTRWLGAYWSATGQVQRENVAAGLPGADPSELPLQAFDLEIDGQALINRWEFAGASERPGVRPGTREAVVELRHQLRPVTVKVVTRLDGTPVLVRYLEITNMGKAPAALARVSPLSGMLWRGSARGHWCELPAEVDRPFTLGYFDGIHQGTEGNFRLEDLPAGRRRIESTCGQSGFGNPFFILTNNVTGESAFGALAWSGNWYAEFWRDPLVDLSGRPSRGLNLAFTMGPQGPAPQRVIAPGETVVSPETHLGLMHAGLDECVAQWHAHLRTAVIPPRPPGADYHTIAGRVVEEPGEWILREIDIAAEMGAQAFMVDAGWYGDEFGGWPDRRGDWHEGAWLPGGLAACRDRAHGHSMRFGLWMEPEAVGSKSNLRTAHPDWLLTTDDGRQTGLMLDLAHPAAAAAFRASVLGVIRDHKLDFFKIDYNTRVQEGGQRDRDGFTESELWRHYETVYGTFDQVRRDLPGVALECCASGGGRNDLGMMARFHYACESDFSMFPRSIRAINGLTLFLPPEALCYYHNHMPRAHQKADLATHLRVTLFARPIFVGFGGQAADRGTPYFEATRRYIKLANEFAGPILSAHPRVFHHTPHIGLQKPADWCVLEYAAEDASAGYAGLFRLGGDAGCEYLFRPRGLDPARRYTVTFDNMGRDIVMDGAELALRGVPVRLDAVNTSELIMYRASESRNGRKVGKPDSKKAPDAK